MDRNAFHKLLAFGVERGVSDIHFEVGYPPHYRLHGELLGAIKVPPLSASDTEAIARMILEDRNIQTDFTRRFAEIDVSYSLAQRGRFRASIFRQRGAVGIVMRLIPIQVLSIEQLNLPPVLAEIALRPRGLVLVTGITGSGKSTALAAMIQHLNEHRKANVITIEDPIEFLHRDINCNINQREVGTDTATFGQALRRVLRQDPDVILTGEIRDLETLDTALKAADTGHLVFSTLHTTDATQTINRVLSFYPPHQQAEVRFSLASALQAVVSLRLVPRADKPGRVPACEILINTQTVRDQIRDMDKTLNIPDLIKEGTVQYGMQSFDQSLMAYYSQGIISYESAVFYATSPSEFALRAQGVAGTSDNSWSGFEQDSTG